MTCLSSGFLTERIFNIIMNMTTTSKNSLTKGTKSVQLYKDTGKLLLERFYWSLRTGELIDPIDLPTSDVYYIWVALKERLADPNLPLGRVAESLYLEGYTDHNGNLIRADEDVD
tara:strand:+ start:256 stop:600 length:345 start_codon:yes stop_codon:yes gene_type:complete